MTTLICPKCNRVILTDKEYYICCDEVMYGNNIDYSNRVFNIENNIIKNFTKIK